jgi:hypothetical protein
MSARDYSVFFTRPLTTGTLLVALVLLALGVRSMLRGGARSPAFMEPEPGEERKGNP